MPLYKINDTSITALHRSTFYELGIKERDDLQRLLREKIEIISPNTLVVAEEFGEWEDSKRRIDLLGIDKDANLVVIELKRSEGGGHMELQAIRYAAMVSTLTFEKVTSVFSAYLEKHNREEDAEALILDFLGWDYPNEDEFAQDVRIVLASADFSKELTTSVLWLNDHGIDVCCTRLRPYQDAGQTILDVQQIIPLPEAAEYQVQVKEKKQKGLASLKSSRDLTKYDVTIDGQCFSSLPKRIAALRVIKAMCDKGVHPDEIINVFPRKTERLFKSVDGIYDDSEGFVQAQISRVARDEGYWFDERRYFTDDDQLIQTNGKTYAIMTGWGRNFDKSMSAVLEAFPDKDIKLAQSVSEGDNGDLNK